MAEIEEILASDDDPADETDISGETEYMHNVVDRGEAGEPPYQDPNSFDDPEKEAESIEPESEVHELANEPFEGEEEFTENET